MAKPPLVVRLLQRFSAPPTQASLFHHPDSATALPDLHSQRHQQSALRSACHPLSREKGWRIRLPILQNGPVVDFHIYRVTLLASVIRGRGQPPGRPLDPTGVLLEGLQI